jgi:hypothetical protein
MEQTLVYNQEETLVRKISDLTVFDQFAQTFFVEENQGVFEIENSHRESNTLKFIRTEIAYKLKDHRVIVKRLHDHNIIISDLLEKSTISIGKSVCRCVSSDLNKLFIQELDRFSNIESYDFNFFSQNIFQRILFPKTKSDLINYFIKLSEGMTWAIIPYNLLHIFFESDKLIINKDDNDKIIFHLGSIERCEIYVNPDDESGKIYYGNYDSILILANKNMKIYENIQGMNYHFEYLFLEQGKIKSLQVK